jgi:hypothetical protein
MTDCDIGGAVTSGESMLTSVNLDNECIRNYVKRMDENLAKLKQLDLKLDIKIIKHPVEQTYNQENLYVVPKKRFGKTRKQRR